MTKRILLITLIATSPLLAEKACKFEKSRIGTVVYEAACVFDVDQDGRLDIVSGEYWFAGPNFKTQHKICTVMPKNQYFDDFCDYPMDVNGDGYIDIITGGWWSKTLQWRENPKGKPVLWKTHDIDQCGNVETIRFWDVDGDGHVEAVPNAGGKVAVYKLLRDANGKGTGKFRKIIIKDSDCGHGLGFGDINGDGRGDFIIPKGWIEAPKKPLQQKWEYHPDFNIGHASVPVLVHDVNEDGVNDLIVGMAHDYGLHWWQQKIDNDKRTFIKHEIDAKRSQYHDLALVDIDKDGKLELITGKRYRAHNGNDPGSADPVGIYYFNINGGKFERVTLDYGPPETHSGAGIYFWTADLDRNGYLDIVAPGKEGLYLFKNLGLK